MCKAFFSFGAVSEDNTYSFEGSFSTIVECANKGFSIACISALAGSGSSNMPPSKEDSFVELSIVSLLVSSGPG